MEIVTNTLNGKTVFTAHVNHYGKEFRVVGHVPPSPKSSYILISPDVVGSADVPDDVAKDIYERLKGGTRPQPTGVTNSLGSPQTSSNTSTVAIFDLGNGVTMLVPKALIAETRDKSRPPASTTLIKLKYPDGTMIFTAVEFGHLSSLKLRLKPNPSKLDPEIEKLQKKYGARMGGNVEIPTDLRTANGLFTLTESEKNLIGYRWEALQLALTQLAPYIDKRKEEYLEVLRAQAARRGKKSQ